MTAGTYDITIEQGATFRLSIIWKDSDAVPVDLTSYTARMQVRQRHASDTPVLSLTSPTDITLGGAAGTVEVTATATATATLAIKSGVYDLELEDTAGVVTRLLQGSVTISPEVTR